MREGGHINGGGAFAGFNVEEEEAVLVLGGEGIGGELEVFDVGGGVGVGGAGG